MSEYPPLSELSVVSILDDIPESAFIYRDDGLLMAMNVACEQHTGVPRAAAVGRFNLNDNKQVMSPALFEAYEDAFRGASKIVPAQEIQLSRASDLGVELAPEVKWVETTIFPLVRRPDGTAPYVLGIQRDISELVRGRLEIQEANKQIDVQRGMIESLEAAQREIEAQKVTIAALSTPVIEVWEGIVTLPLLGHFNAERAGAMTSQLLAAVARTRARYAILDLTGMTAIDAATCDHVLRAVAAVGLLGTTGVLVGIQPEIAQMLVTLGVELGRVRTYQNLRQALKACMQDRSTD